VGTVGVVEICMVIAFPVPRFFFGIVGRAFSTVGKLCTVGSTVGRKPLRSLTFRSSQGSHGRFPTLRNPPEHHFATFVFPLPDFHMYADRSQECRRSLEST
jgi:hypothetical protein